MVSCPDPMYSQPKIYVTKLSDVLIDSLLYQTDIHANADKAGEDIQRRLKRAEGHIEAGRLLEFYQVSKCCCILNYFSLCLLAKKYVALFHVHIFQMN